MAADGSILIDTKIKLDNLEKQLKEVNEKLKTSVMNGEKDLSPYQELISKLTGSIGASVEEIKNFASSTGVAGAAVLAEVAILKKYIAAVKESNEVYEKWNKSEKALQISAKNNPYLNGESVAAIEDYAKSLENTSNYSAQQLLQIMSELASTGRDQKQIFEIMGAAADYAAGTQTDLSSAVQQLNMTYSGMAGTLGRQISGVKDLTEEQLKNGDAVKAVAAAYKGMASEMADGGVQAQNAKTKFKQSFGELVNPTVDIWDKFWKSFYDKGAAAINSLNGLLNSIHDKIFGTIGEVSVKNIITEAKKDVKDGDYRSFFSIAADKATDEQLKSEKEYLESLKSRNSLEADYLKEINIETKNRNANNALRTSSTASKTAESTFDVAGYKNKNIEALNKEIEKIELEAKATGKEVDEQAKLNALINAYISLINDSNGTVSENNVLSQERLKQIKEQQDIVSKIDTATNLTKQAQSTVEQYAVKEEQTPEQQYISQYHAAQDMYAKIEELSDEDVAKATNGEMTKSQLLYSLYETECNLTDKAAEEHKKADAAEVASKKASTQEMIDIVNNYAQQSNQIAQDAANLALTQVKTESEAKIAELEDQHNQGLVSDEDYQKQKEEIEEDAAKKQYKIQMFAWTASILAATANIAEGVTKAIAQGGVMGIITGALVSAAGAVQIASLIASKPVPPSFATGGIVPGASYAGDRIQANVNSGEMILNAKQQRALWNTANGKNGGNGSNIIVNNAASNIVSAQPQITEDGVKTLINITVRDALKKGKYNKELSMANSGMTGTVYPT